MALNTSVEDAFESEGHVTQQVIPPVITGAEVTRQKEAQNAARGNPFGDVAKIVGAVSGALEGLAKGESAAGSDMARDQGTQAGQAAVTRDANGNLQIQPPASAVFGGGLLSGLGAAISGDDKTTGGYRHAALSGALAKASLDVDTDINTLRLKYPGDPAGFQTAAQNYLAGLSPRISSSGIAGGVTAHANERINEYFNNMTTQQAAQQTKDAGTAIETKIAADHNDAYNLALQGGLSAPDGTPQHDAYLKAYSNIVAGYQQLKDNRQFGYTPEQVDEHLHNEMIGMHDADNQGQIDAAYKKQGAVAAAAASQDRINSLQGISEAQRQTLIAHGQARIQFNSGQNADAVQANRQAFDGLQTAFASGKIDARNAPPIIDQIIKRAGDTGDIATSQNASAWRATHPISPAVTGLSPSQTNTSLGVNTAPRIAGQPMPGGGYAVPQGGVSRGIWSLAQTQDYIRQEAPRYGVDPSKALRVWGAEGLNTGVFDAPGGYPGAGWYSTRQNDAGHSIGPFQLNDQGLGRQFKQETGLDPRDPANIKATVDFSLAWAAKHGWNPGGVKEGPGSSTGGGWHAATNIGIGNWEGIRPGAAGVTPGEGPVGTGTAPTGGGVPFTQAQLDQNPYLLSNYVRSLSEDGETREKTGQVLGASLGRAMDNLQLPQHDDVVHYMQVSDDGRHEAEREKIATQYGALSEMQGARVGGGGGGSIPFTAGGQPSEGGGIPALQALEAEARGRPDLQHQNMAVTVGNLVEKAGRLLKSDPGAYANAVYKTPVPAPIDFTSAQSIAGGVALRGAIAGKIAQNEPGAEQSAIFPQDMQAAKNIISFGQPDQKLALLAAVAQLNSPSREETFAKLGETGADGAGFAQAGHVAAFDPGAAQDMITGAALLKNEPKLAPKDSDLQDAFKTSLPHTDLPMAGARGRVLEGAKEYYAAQMAKMNDTSQSLNKDVWDQSVNAVTGGVLDYRGTKIVAPDPGMTQDQLQQRLNALTDADMRGATIGGQPLTADVFKPSWRSWLTTNPIRLVTRDPDKGEYHVFGGPSDAKQPAIASDGNPLILYLGARQ